MDGRGSETAAPAAGTRAYWVLTASAVTAVALWSAAPTAGVAGIAPETGLLRPGGIGAALWQSLDSLAGLWGGEAVGRLAAGLLLLIAMRRLSGIRWAAEGHRLMGLCLAAGGCALLPPGPDALLLPWAAALLVAPTPAALVLAFAGPSLTPLALWGALAAALAAWESGQHKRAVGLVGLALLSPAGAMALWEGSLVRPFVLSGAGEPWSGWAAAPSASWALPLWGVAVALWAAWPEEGLRSHSATVGGLGLVCRPLAGLPLLGANRGRPEARPPLWLALAGLPALLLTLTFPPGAPPPGAVRWVETLPAGTRLRVEVAWLRALSGKAPAGVSVVGTGEAAPLWRERGDTLAPPFADAPAPAEEVRLLSAHYPAGRTPRPYRDGWRPVALGPDWVAFARLSSPGPWRACLYDPYQPLPSEEPARSQALAEALALASSAPTFFEAQRDGGRLLLDLGRYDEALAHLQAALALRPQSAALLNDVGTALHQLGRGAEAETYYIRSIRADPQELLPRMNLAGLYAGQGRVADAELVLGDLIAKRPGFVPARRMLIELLLQAGRMDEAVAAVRGIPPDSRTAQERELAELPPSVGGTP